MGPVGVLAKIRLAMALAAVAAQEVVELDSCEEAQQALEEYLVDAPQAPRSACHGSLEPGEDVDGLHIQTTPLCAQWRGECAANRSISECSVGCERLPGCRLHPEGPAIAQPGHPHGEAAAGMPGRCVPDEAQCVCPDEMLPLVRQCIGHVPRLTLLESTGTSPGRAGRPSSSHGDATPRATQPESGGQFWLRPCAGAAGSDSIALGLW